MIYCRAVVEDEDLCRWSWPRIRKRGMVSPNFLPTRTQRNQMEVGHVAVPDRQSTTTNHRPPQSTKHTVQPTSTQLTLSDSDSDSSSSTPCISSRHRDPPVPVASESCPAAMKLQQYINSFTAPLAAEDARPLVRLLACRNKTARGLSDTVGAIEVGRAVSRRCHRFTTYNIHWGALMPG